MRFAFPLQHAVRLKANGQPWESGVAARTSREVDEFLDYVQWTVEEIKPQVP
jgi:hypothetical protein